MWNQTHATLRATEPATARITSNPFESQATTTTANSEVVDVAGWWKPRPSSKFPDYDQLDPADFAHYMQTQNPVDIWSLLHLAIGFLATYALGMPWWVAVLLHQLFEIWEQTRQFSRLWNALDSSGYYGDKATGTAWDTFFFVVGAALGEYARQVTDKYNRTDQRGTR